MYIFAYTHSYTNTYIYEIFQKQSGAAKQEPAFQVARQVEAELPSLQAAGKRAAPLIYVFVFITRIRLVCVCEGWSSFPTPKVQPFNDTVSVSVMLSAENSALESNFCALVLIFAWPANSRRVVCVVDYVGGGGVGTPHKYLLSLHTHTQPDISLHTADY